MIYCPGPGDEETWPPYSGHPHDPRMEDDFEWPEDDTDEEDEDEGDDQ